jgi:DNA (cytosine-5)-methyltransferase 1
MVVADCGVELSGPLSARDYKDAGTDGMNKISAKMVPVVQDLVGALDTECGGNKLTHQSVANGHIVAARMVAFGEYSVDGTASAMKARDWKDATDLVAQPVAYNISPGKGELKDDIHVTDAHISKTIDASASNPAMHQGGSAIVQAMAVRRLTPVECERLQGFPDGYTNIPWRKAAESPDGPRYKALGNSWAVPVVAWIGKRIQDQLK